jgi:TonB family protein
VIDVQHRPALWHAVGLSVLGHGLLVSQLVSAVRAPEPGRGHRAPAVFEVTGVAIGAAVAARPSGESSPSAPTQEANVSGNAAQPGVPPAAVAPAALEASYLPRSELTVAPRPTEVVQVPFPEEITGVVDLDVRLTLFIDENGVVRRLRIDTPHVHPAFDRALRAAFTTTRFQPGERDGVPVRSQLRLEVQFEAPAGRRGRS